MIDTKLVDEAQAYHSSLFRAGMFGKPHEKMALDTLAVVNYGVERKRGEVKKEKSE